MIRVLHVIESLGGGGAERQLAMTVVRSDPCHFQHVICALGSGARYARVLREAGVPVYMLHRRPRHEPVATLGALRRLIRLVDPDIVHTSLYWADVLGRAAARVTRRPVVTTLVNTTYEPDWYRDNPLLSRPKVEFLRILDSMTARRWGTWFVAVTEAVRTSAVRTLGVPSDRTSVIYRGLPLDEKAPLTAEGVASFRKRLKWEGRFPVILSVGRLVPQKGHRYVVEALPRVTRLFPSALLVIVGEGPLREGIVQLAESTGQADHLHLLGERDDVADLLAAADLFAFPSLYEGFAGALVEAMAASKPCVASAFAGAGELTNGGRTARIVPLASPDAIADALVTLAQDPVQARSLGETAGAWARRFDIRESVRSLERLYEQLCGQPVGSPTAVGGRPEALKPR